MQGWDEPVFYQGEEVGAVRRYSDVQLIFLLKARRPEVYRERAEVTVSRPPVDPAQLSDEELDAIHNSIQKHRGRSAPRTGQAH